MDFCTTHTPENTMSLFNQTTNDGAILTLALRMIPVALILAALFS